MFNKKFLGLISLVVLSIFIGSFNVNAQAPAVSGGVALNRNLSVGLRGSDVTSLQQFLVSQGLLSEGNTTGFFGPLTQAAVQSFQAKQGIVTSGTPQTTGYGSVGPRTLTSINTLNAGASSAVSTVGMPSTTSATVASTQAPQVTITSSPSSVNPGQSSTLTWSSSNATSCRANLG